MLYLKVLGTPSVEREGQPLPPLKSRKALALLTFLALCPGAHARSELAGLLWSDNSEKKALDNLRFALWTLNRILHSSIIQADRVSVSFERCDGVRIDADIFSHSLRQLDRSKAPTSGEISEWESALDLYRGDLLAGLDLREDVVFVEWLERQRVLFREMAVHALYRLSTYYTALPDRAKAIAATRRLLAFDPWREEGHRQLMLLLAHSGQHSAALAQYETCRRLLAQELGVEPSEETRRHHARIRAAYSSPQPDLPPQPNPFVARDEELAQIAHLVANPACRLMTLVGPGGSGKTRIALAAALAHRGEFLHGAAFVPLVSVTSTEMLVSAIAQSLGFAFQVPSRDPRAQLIDYLREKELLIVLDNFEHLMGATDLILEILQSARDVRLLVTTRERLNLRWEWLCEIQGMTESSAVELFLQTACRVQPGFVLTDDQRPCLTRICHLVDRMPLGIELAAGSVKAHSCQEIAREIASDLNFLTTTLRDVTARHRSLRAAFDHSWRFLTDPERRTFICLSVFRGGFSERAAQIVVNGEWGVGSADDTQSTPHSSLSTIHSLVDKSLLRHSPSGRYEMHELLRQYGEEKLAQDAPLEESVHERHGTYFARFLHQRAESTRGADSRQAMEEVTGELENVRSSWRWAVQQRRTAEIAQSLEALYTFYEVQGWFQEGADALAMALDALREHGGSEKVRGRIAARQGWLYHNLGKVAQAKTAYEESMELFRTLGTRNEMAFPLNGLGYAAWRSGDYDQARQLLRESLVISQEFTDRRGTARASANLGIVASLCGDYDQARELYQACLTIYRELGDHKGTAGALNNLGIDARKRGDYALAKQFLQESLTLREQIGYRWGVAVGLNNLGNVIAAMGDYGQAKNLYEQALVISGDIGDRRSQLGCLLNLGNAAGALGQVSESKAYHHQALRIGLETRSIPQVLEALVGIASLLEKEGKLDRCVELLALTVNHPASIQEHRDASEQRLVELQALLPPQTFAAAIARGKTQTLDQAVSEFLT